MANLHQRGAQGKHAAGKELKAQVNGKMVSQVYDCTRLKVFTRKEHMREGQTVLGCLTMKEEFENFEFRQTVGERWERNPLMWRGKYLNVHRDKQGCYQVNFRKMVMSRRFNATRIAKAIYTELETAKKVLGL